MPEDKQYSRLKVGELSSAMIAGSIRPLLGSRMLMPYLHSLKNEVDPEIFCLFQGVDSESDAYQLDQKGSFGRQTLCARKMRKQTHTKASAHPNC